MKAKHINSRIDKPAAGKAVVVGGGIAGLLAAQVLVKHFEQVTVIDRDRLPDEPEFRAGTPQAMHAHTLLPHGQMILEELFPGLVDRLLAEGAELIDTDRETAYFEEGVWKKPALKARGPVVSCSRPMLENLIYRWVSEQPRVAILQGYEMAGLVVDEKRSRVKGLNARDRGQPGAEPLFLPADLVVDASGRGSKAPQWLASLGFTPPEEWTIDAHAGYASRIYRQPPGFERSWKKLYISPRPPEGTRGGVIVPLEGSRWHVTLIGLSGDFPPTDEAGFEAFARSLPSPALFEAIQGAEPLGRIAGFRKNENRVRRFENLPRYLEGLLVLGDAAYTMNPVYALGMTAAAVSSQVLEEVLRKERPSEAGLAADFQKKLAARVTALWRQAVAGDWQWPATEISDNTEALYPAAA